MSRRIALSLASLAVVLLAAGSAAAWETRVLTLGDQNRFVEDDANIWLYPQKVMRYGDRLYLDLARKEGRVIDSNGEAEGLEAIKGLNGGFFLDVTENLHLAFWASEYTDHTTYTYLQGVTHSQNNPERADCGGLVPEREGAPPNNNCRMAGESITGDAFREPAGGFTTGANRKLDVFGGIRFSPSFDLGAHFWFGKGTFSLYSERNISEDKKHFEDHSGGSATTDWQFSTSTFGLGIGATISLFADSHLDLGFRYANYSYTMDDATVLKPTVDGGNQIGFDGRMVTRLSKHWFLVPSMQFGYTGFTGIVDVVSSPADSSGIGLRTSTLDWTNTNFDLGLGLHMKVIGKASLFTAVGLDYNKDEFHSASDWGADHIISYTTMQLPYWRTGFEAPLFSWLDFRAGFIKRMGTWQGVDDYLDPGNIDEDTDKEAYRRRGNALDDVSYSLDSENAAALRNKGFLIPLDFETFVGATMHREGWFFTVEVDPNFLFHGPFNPFVGGASAEEALASGDKPWFGRFEISYRF